MVVNSERLCSDLHRLCMLERRAVPSTARPCRLSRLSAAAGASLRARSRPLSIATLRIFCVLLVGSGVTRTVAAQEPGAPVFRVGSETVVIDLIATDRDGRFVADLQPSEIQVFEEGKVQKALFVRVMGTRRGAPADTSAPTVSSTTLARSNASQDQSVADVPLALVFDLLSMPRDAFLRMRDAVLRLIDTGLPEGISIMVATVTDQLTIRQPFTRDRAAVRAAVESMSATLAGNVSVTDVTDQVDQLCAAGSPRRVEDSAIETAKAVVQEANRRVTVTSRSLAMLAQSLATIPGRKQMALYSAGYAISPANMAIDAVTASLAACTNSDMVPIRRRAMEELGPLASPDAANGIRLVVDRANRAQVSFYTVDPRGLLTDGVMPQHGGRSRTGGNGPMVRLPGLDETLTREYLRNIASETGGRSFFNTNDIGLGFRRAWEDADSYYLIGYEPTLHRNKGRFRKVTLKVTRPDLDLRYRRGYFETTEQERVEEDVEYALHAPEAFDRPGFEVVAIPEGKTLKIAVRIPPAAIRFTPAGTEQRADFSVHGELRDAKGALVGGKPLAGRDVALRFNAERFAAVRAADRLIVWLETSLPATGQYRLAVVARDSGGWIAVRIIDVAVKP
jgi:VWFA-related protein